MYLSYHKISKMTTYFLTNVSRRLLLARYGGICYTEQNLQTAEREAVEETEEQEKTEQ